MIVGSQHFVTFDQRHYDFKGHCSYLLANDFIGHEFSLVLSYEPEIKGHYTVLLMLGTETVSIDLLRKVSPRFCSLSLIGYRHDYSCYYSDRNVNIYPCL